MDEFAFAPLDETKTYWATLFRAAASAVSN